LIVSSDKDFAQIVGGNIRVMLPPPAGNPKAGWRVLDEAGVLEKFGVKPAQIAAYLSLVGDVSDNIPGIMGVGPKTAAKWLAAHDKLPTLLENAATLTPERLRESLLAGREILERNMKLVTLNLNLGVRARGTENAVDFGRVIKFLENFELKGALNEARLRQHPQPAAEKLPTQGELF
jgi:DNA polymerase-1